MLTFSHNDLELSLHQTVKLMQETWCTIEEIEVFKEGKSIGRLIDNVEEIGEYIQDPRIRRRYRGALANYMRCHNRHPNIVAMLSRRT